MSAAEQRTMDAATLWRTRVTWALVGAAGALVITGLRERERGEAVEASEASGRAVEPTTAVVAAEPRPTAADSRLPVPTPEGTSGAITDAGPVVPLATPSDPTASPTAPTVVPATAPAATAPAATAPAATAPAATAPAATPVEPFEIPLPLMPGARVMTRGQRPDEELGGTIYTLTVSVPAPGMQVESFYRSALVDAKLSVSGGSREPSTIGSGLRTSLRGRGRDASVHVNLQQRAGKLRTTVRIIWRTLP